MGKTVTRIAIGAAIIGAAFLTGGAALLPAISTAGTAIGGVTVGAVSIGAALSTTAIGAMALATGAGLVLSGASQALAKTPKVSLSQLDRLNASLVPSAPRKMWLGETAGATDIRYVEPSGTNQEYIDYIIATASHAVEGIDQLWFEDTQAWTGDGGVTAKYRGYLWVTVRTEGSAANAIAINGGRKWGATRRLTGCAYIHVRIKRTGNGKKAESPFSGGLPSRLTIIGCGAKLYDPRRDSSVPGGSGPMRANDQSTWRYRTDDGAVIGENLALQSLWYLLGWRINGKLAVGCGQPPARLNLPSFIEAANLADEAVTLATGGSQARYAGAGVWSEADDPGTVLQGFATACNGRFRDGGGQLALAIMHNDLAIAATDDGLNDDDVLSPFTWNPDPSLEGSFNIVRGRYTDPSDNSLYQLVDYPEISFPSPDGLDRILPLDLPLCEDPARAQRIAKQVLQRKQYDRSFTATFGARAWAYQVGDVLPFTFSPLGFDRALFRVQEQQPTMDGTCPMVLTVEHPQIYAWDRDDSASVQAAEPIRYDPLNNPIVLAVDEAGRTAEWGGVFGPGKPDDNATRNVFRGAYEAGATYAIGDQVSDQATIWSYSGEHPGTGHAPPRLPDQSNEYWQQYLGAGRNTVTLTLYQRAVAAPAVPSQTVTYRFSDATALGLNNGWQRSVPGGSDPLWATAATFSSVSDTDTAEPNEWTAPVVLARDGAGGLNTAPLFLYQRAAAKPAQPSQPVTYTFAGAIAVGIDNGWMRSVPEGADPVWITQATAASGEASDVIASGEWSDPVMFARNGDPGPAGYNNLQMTLYRRAAGPPPVPDQTVTYRFSTKVATGIDNGWSRDLPAGSDQLWATVGSFASTTDTDAIEPNEWAAPVAIGAAGLSSATLCLYQRAGSRPPVPSQDVTYTVVDAAALGINNGWMRGVPDGTDPIWITLASAASAGGSDTIVSAEWATPVILAQNGEKGEKGDPGGGGAAAAPGVKFTGLGTFPYIYPVRLPPGASQAGSGAGFPSVTKGRSNVTAELQYRIADTGTWTAFATASTYVDENEPGDLAFEGSFTNATDQSALYDIQLVVSRGGSGSITILEGSFSIG